MRPTVDGEIVFEGKLETQVAAQLLKDRGNSDMIESISPAVEPAGIGLFKFISDLAEADNGLGDSTEYTCSKEVSADILRALFAASIITSPERPTLNRKRWMGQRLFELVMKIEAMAQKKSDDENARIYGHIVEPSDRAGWPNPSEGIVDPLRRNVIEVGGLTIVGATDAQASILKRREAFVNTYCTERGWDTGELTIQQTMEVRNQPGWKNPS